MDSARKTTKTTEMCNVLRLSGCLCRIGLLLFICASLSSVPHVRSALVTQFVKSRLDDQEVELFREYLRIPSVQPNVDYKPVVAYLQRQADSVSLPLKVYYPSSRQKPMVVVTWAGSQPSLPSIVFNSHMDVVPVVAENWLYPPFAADVDDQGNIFARGAQDMKAAGAQYFAAIRALKRTGVKQLKRTVHLVYANDEEIGSADGWAAFVTTDAFKALNTGFFVDEGATSETTAIGVYYAERTAIKLDVKCVGETGHAAFLLANTAAEKCLYVYNKMYRLRRQEARRLANNASLELGDVTTINLTMLQGGIASNIIPQEIHLLFDARVTLGVQPTDFIQMVNRWAREAGANVTVSTDLQAGTPVPTVVGAADPYWMAIANALSATGGTAVPMIMPAATDSFFIRRIPIPAVGFSPLVNTIAREHADNEYLNINTYLNGINVFAKVMTNLASV